MSEYICCEYVVCTIPSRGNLLFSFSLSGIRYTWILHRYPEVENGVVELPYGITGPMYVYTHTINSILYSLF